MKLIKIVLIIAVLLCVKDLWHRFHKHELSSAQFAGITLIQGSLPKEDSPVLVEFWATWCGPCRQSIPHLNALFAQHGSQLAFIGLTRENPEVVSAFMKQVPINYAVGIDSTLHRQFGVSGIPHAFLFNAQRKLVWEGHPMALQEADLKKAL